MSTASTHLLPAAALAVLLLVAGCAAGHPASDDDARAGTPSGTVTYPPRIAMPPDAGLTVHLLDADRADAPVDDETFRSCRCPREAGPWEEARRLGVDFRAVGQEPGWHLEIREGDRIRLVYDYGEREVITPALTPSRSDGRTVYRARTQGHKLTVTISEAPCTDVMSGERFEATVTVTLDGETYRGCGRTLR